jgi:hypothetical protein
MAKDRKFKELYEIAKKDKNIIGFFLGGSRGKCRETIHSDYDTYLVVKDSVFKEYDKKYSTSSKDLDVAVFPYTGFKKHAEIGSEFEWDRYNYAHLKVLIDRKDIQKLVNEKGIIPKNRIKKYVSGYLDCYINAVYRSFKCDRDGNPVGLHLQAAESIPAFLNVAFAIHNGRLKPYYKYLEWEFETYPLKKFSLTPKELLRMILQILKDGDLKTQRELFNITEKVLKKEGYGKVYDSWGCALDLIRN